MWQKHARSELPARFTSAWAGDSLALGFVPFRNSHAVNRIAALIICSLLACAGSAAETIVILEARHRPADELVEALRPLLLQSEALSATGSQIIVRADAAGLDRIKEALAQLDRPLRQLQISLRRADAATIESETIAARAHASADSLHVQTYVTAADTDIAATGVRRVVVREGNEALIDTSRSVPQFAGAIVETRSSGATRTAAGIGVHELHEGFRIVPRLAGTHVELEISTRQERADGEVISTQRATSQVSGEMGMWLRMGSVAHRATPINSHSLSTRRDELEWWVRVDEIEQAK